MSFAPFRYLGLFFLGDRILLLVLARKCAIFFFSLPLQRKYCAGDLRKAHLRDVPGGSPQSIQNILRIEIRHKLEISIFKIVSRVNAAPGQKHEAHAVLYDGAVAHLKILLVQFL